MILFGLRDTGSANACLPVIKVLRDRMVPISVYAEGAAYERFKDKFKFISGCKIDSLLDTVKPSLVVATTAVSGGTIPTDLINAAKQRSLLVVLVEDMWASHSASNWTVLPDSVCAMDEIAKNLILKSWLGYPESRIHLTGMPTFDKYADIQLEKANFNLRKILHLDKNWPIIFFAGQIWGMPQAVKMIIEVLNSFDLPTYLVLADRPAITSPQARTEFKNIYLEYRKELDSLQTGTLVDLNGLANNEAMAASDIVIGMYSTMTIEACYLRKPLIIISTPEINQSLAEATNNALNQWPLINLGVSLKAENVDEARTWLRKILAGDVGGMLQAQRKHFQTDGLSANRIANVILNYYK